MVLKNLFICNFFFFYFCNGDAMISFRIYDSITKINYKGGEKGIWDKKFPFHSKKFKQSWIQFIFCIYIS